MSDHAAGRLVDRLMEAQKARLNSVRETHVPTVERRVVLLRTTTETPFAFECRESASALRELEHLVFLAGVGPVLELDDAELLEALAEPAGLALRGTRIEQAELLAVGHDLGEEHLLEQLALRADHHEVDGLLDVDAEAIPDLLHQEPVAHADRRLEGELLALVQLGG